MGANTALFLESGGFLGDPEMLKLKFPGSEWTGEMALDYWGKRYGRGKKAVVQSFANDEMIYDTSLTLEQKLEKIKKGFEADPTTPDYKNAPFYIDAVGAALESAIPGMQEALTEGVAVGAAGALGTVALGGGSALGFGIGMPLGMAENFRRQMRGAGYGDLLMAGLSEENAKAGAEIIGLGGAGLNMMGATAAAGAGKAIFGATLRKTTQNQVVRNLLPLAKRIETNTYVNLFAKGVEAVGVETAEEGAQQVLSDLTRIGYLLQEKGLIGEDNPEGVDLGEEYAGLKTNASQAMIEAFKAAMVLGVVGGGASYGAGKTLGSLQKMSSDPKVVQAINAAMDSEGAQFVRRSIQNLADTLEDARYKFEKGDIDESQIDLEAGKLVVRVEQKASPIQELSAAAEAAKPLPENADVMGTQPQAVSVADVIEQTIQAAAKGQQNLFQFDDAQKQALDEIFTDTPQAPAQQAPSATTITQELAPVEEQDMQPLSSVEVEARANENASTLRVLKKKEKQLVRDIGTATTKGRATAKMVDTLDEVRARIAYYENENEILEMGLAVREDMKTAPNSDSETGVAKVTKYGRLTMRKFAALVDKIAAQAEKIETQKQKFDEKLSAVDLAATKRGEKIGRRAVMQAQKQLSTAINAVTKDRSIRRELKALIAGATTPATLITAGKKIQERFDKLMEQEAQREFLVTKNKLLGRIEGLLKKGFPSNKKGYPTVERVDADTADALRAFAGVIRNPSSAVEARETFLEKYGEKLERGFSDEIPTNELLQFKMVELAALVNEAQDLLTLNVAEATLRNMVEEAKAEIEQRKEERRKKVEELTALGDAAFGVTAWKNAQKDKASTNLPSEKRAAWLQTIYAQTLTFDRLLETLMQENEAAQQLLELLDEFSAKEEYLTNTKTISDRALKPVNDILRKAGIPLSDYLISLNEEVYRLNYRDPAGQIKFLDATKGEMIDIWMKLQAEAPIIRATMQDTDKGNGWSTYDTQTVKPGETLEAAIETALNDTDKKVGQALLDFYNNDYYYANNEWYRGRYNTDLPFSKNYSPLKRNLVKIGSFDVDQLHYASYLPPSMKSRVKSLQRLRPQNPFQTVREHIDSWEYAKAYGDLLDNLSILFRRSDVSDYIASNYGKGTTTVIGDFIDRFILNDPMPSSELDSFWASLRADMTSAFLSFGGVPQALTQITAGHAVWAGFNPAELFMGAVDYALHPKKTETALRESQILSDRWEGGSSLDLNLMRSYTGMWFNTISKLAGKSVIKPSEKLSAFQKASFLALRFGEAAIVRMFGGPLYHAALRRGMDSSEALMHVARMVEKTQQSRAVSQIPNIYASRQLVYMLFGMFGLQPAQLWSHWSTAQTMWNKRSLANKAKTLPALVGAAFTFWWLPNFMYSLIPALPALLPGGDGEDDKRDILGAQVPERVFDAGVQSIATTANPNVPVFGRVLESLWFEAAKEYLGSDMPAFSRTDPLTKTLYENPMRAYKDWQTWFDKANPKDVDAILELATDPDKKKELRNQEAKAQLRTIEALAPLTGVPRKPPQAAINTPFLIERKDYVGAAMSLLGWSPGSISARVSDNQKDPLDTYFDKLGSEEGEDKSPFEQQVEAAKKTYESILKTDQGKSDSGENSVVQEYEDNYFERNEADHEMNMDVLTPENSDILAPTEP